MNHAHRIRTVSVRQQSFTLEQPRQTSWLNVGLGALTLCLLVYYVVQSNMLAAQIWKTNQVQTQLAGILEQRNTLVAQQSELNDRQVLQDLAVREGFEPAGAVVYLVQDAAVAAAR